MKALPQQLQNSQIFSPRRSLLPWLTDLNPRSQPPSILSFASTPNSSPSTSTLSASSAAAGIIKPVVVVGSANADIYLEIDHLPREGETVAARNGETLAGGKGANQACCGSRLAHPTHFVGRIGDDVNGNLIENALRGGGVLLDRLGRVAAAPTGFAVVMLQPNGQNSIVIVSGANVYGWTDEVCREDLEVVSGAGVVLLQREIPDRVNIQVAEAAKNSGIPVILDAGGMESPIPDELLKVVDILSPNETELQCLTGMPTETFEQISQAVMKCHEMGVKKVLLKLGSKGSALFVDREEPIIQAVIPAAGVVDTTGAGDTFTAAFAVALVENVTMKGCLEFAAAAASLCVEVKGAIPSMPDRKAVVERLRYLNAESHHASYL